MVEVAFAIPGDLAAPTGGYAYARRLLELLPRQGIGIRHTQLPGSFPHPTEADLEETARVLREVSGSVLLIDGLAYGAMPADLIRSLARPVVALVHHPLGFENGVDERRRWELLALERAALAAADWVIANSAATARVLVDTFDVPESRVTVAEPGTEPQPRATGTGAPVALLAVGAVSSRKGYDLLIKALHDLQDLDWRLTIVGALDREPEAVAALRAVIEASGLTDRIRLAGAVQEAELATFYDRADVFVSPSLYEGYGMALAEALAHGLPLVASTGGAAADTVPDEAGLKVPPGDVAALRDALRRMITDPSLRRTFADGSWAAGQRLPRWTNTASRVAEALRRIA